MDNNYSPRNRPWSCSYFTVLNSCIVTIIVTTYFCSRMVSLPSKLPSFLGGHFHDLLATPLFLASSNIWIYLCGRPALAIVSLRSILGLSLLAGWFWEFITPYYRHSITDVRDLVAYVIGGLLYFTILHVYKKMPNEPVHLTPTRRHAGCLVASLPASVAPTVRGR
jgi:hypothetical protein